MDDVLADHLSQLRDALAQSRDEMLAAHRALQSLEVAVDSPDRSMRLRLNGSGEVTRFEIRDDGYLDLSARELADSITALFRAAQEKHRQAVLDAAPAMPFSGLSLPDLLAPSADADRLFPEDIFGNLFSADLHPRTGGSRG